MKMTNREFGNKLRRALMSNAAYQILGTEGTWASGGCLILANSLIMVLGLSPEDRYSIVDASNLGYELYTEHVVIASGNGFLDADGFSTELTLLQRWRQQEGLRDPQLLSFHLSTTSLEIPRDSEQSKRLASFLAATILRQ